MGIFLSFKNTNYKIPLQEDTKQGIFILGQEEDCP